MKHIDVRDKRGSAADKALTPTEKILLQNKLTDSKDRIIFILGAYAGMRATEISQCRLEWLQIEVIKEHKVLFINIPAEFKDTRNLKRKIETKSRESRRTYVFDPYMMNEVWFWYKNNIKGLLMSRQAIDHRIRRRWYKILVRGNFSTHALRASAQNYFRYEMKLPDVVIQTILGHKDIKTTLLHYNSKTAAQVEEYLAGTIVTPKSIHEE